MTQAGPTTQTGPTTQAGPARPGRIDLASPVLRRSSVGQDPAPLRLVLDWGQRLRLSCYNLGLACCAVEFVAAAMARPDLPGLGVDELVGGPASADVLVVSGTLTDKLAPVVRRVYEAMAEPRYVISFGSCATCGGPYWDSYCVTKGVDQIVPVDVYVPGCPPRPEALLQGVLRLQQLRAGGAPAPVPPRAAQSLTAPVTVSPEPGFERRTW